MKKVVTWVSGPLLAAFFLWLCFRGVDGSALWRGVRESSPTLLAISAAIVIVHMFVRAARWRTLLADNGRHAPYYELVSAVTIGYMASLLPGRVGEVLRPALLSRRVGVKLGASVATVAVERIILDLGAVMLCGAIGLVVPQRLSGLAPGADQELIALLRGAGSVILVGVAAALLAMHVAARHRERLSSAFESIAQTRRSAFVARVLRALGSLLPGLDGFRTVGGTVRLIVETMIVWGVISVGVHTGIVACGVELAPLSALIMVPILAIGIGIPTPGGTGPYHAAMLIGLTQLFGATKEQGLVAGLVVHAVTWLPVMILGGFFVARGGLAKRALPSAGMDGAATDVADAETQAAEAGGSSR